MITLQSFNLLLLVMAILAVVVFVSLFFVNAGYGKFYQPKWGPSLDNHLGWFLMEVPVFIVMLVLWWFSGRRGDTVRLVFLLLFELHYFHRSFIFPSQLRGHSRMPWTIVLMGALFNTVNALMQGGWIFYVTSPPEGSADHRSPSSCPNTGSSHKWHGSYPPIPDPVFPVRGRCVRSPPVRAAAGPFRSPLRSGYI